jgi:hypothetical protein
MIYDSFPLAAYSFLFMNNGICSCTLVQDNMSTFICHQTKFLKIDFWLRTKPIDFAYRKFVWVIDINLLFISSMEFYLKGLASYDWDHHSRLVLSYDKSPLKKLFLACMSLHFITRFFFYYLFHSFKSYSIFSKWLRSM